MSQENFNPEKIRVSVPELSTDDWEKYKIPATGYGLTPYINRLWLPEFFNKKGSNYGFNKKSIIETLAKGPGYILDIGAGKSGAMVKLNEALVEQGGEPKAIRLDLLLPNKVDKEYADILKTGELILEQTGADKEIIKEIIEKEKKNLMAVGADVFNLPIKDEKFKLVVSNELIPYFLENRDSQDYKIFLRLRQLSWRLCELYEKSNLLNGEEAAEYEKISTEINDLPTPCNLMYDLELFKKFFSEIDRILKKGFQPPAEARIYPFMPMKLIDQEIGASRNKQRVKDFASIMDNFESANFYPDFELPPEYMEQIRKTGQIKAMAKCYKSLGEDIANSLQKIIANPNHLVCQGVLVLRK